MWRDTEQFQEGIYSYIFIAISHGAIFQPRRTPRFDPDQADAREFSHSMNRKANIIHTVDIYPGNYVLFPGLKMLYEYSILKS